ncbi:hypothetical protein ACPF8X_18840 [Streptomyces sp. G35A]
MAEIIQKDGTRTFDGDAPRLTPGRDKNVGLLRRLRELGEPHRSGVPTDEESTLAKQAVLKRL